MPLYSWGSNSHGQLGHGADLVGCDSHSLSHMTYDPQSQPPAEAPPSSYMAACGANHSIVCLDACRLYACGLNGHGQLGTGDTLDRSSLARIHLNCFSDPSQQYRVLSLACGWDYTLILVESELKRFLIGFGSNAYSALLCAEPRLLQPTILVHDDRLDQMASGVRHVLALSRCGSLLWSWGESRHGKLGPQPHLAHANASLSLLDRHHVAWQCPTTEPSVDSDRIEAFCASHQFSAILTRSRRLLIFGKWDATSRSALFQLHLDDQLPPIHSLFANWNTLFAFSKTQGRLFGFGRNRYGQLGEPSLAQPCMSTSLCAIPIEPYITALATGSEHLLALVRRPTCPQPSVDLIAWGWNEHGQLGTSPSLPFLSAATPFVLRQDQHAGPLAPMLASGYSHNILYWP